MPPRCRRDGKGHGGLAADLAAAGAGPVILPEANAWASRQAGVGVPREGPLSTGCPPELLRERGRRDLVTTGGRWPPTRHRRQPMHNTFVLPITSRGRSPRTRTDTFVGTFVARRKAAAPETPRCCRGGALWRRPTRETARCGTRARASRPAHKTSAPAPARATSAPAARKVTDANVSDVQCVARREGSGA